MSRNFELLEQIEKELADGIANNGAHKDTFRSDEHVSSEHSVDLIDSDLANLVQSVFAPISGSASHRVVLCGVDKVNASSSICARVAHTLAATTRENVCLVDLNPCATGLSNLMLSSTDRHGAGHSEGQRNCVQVAEHLWLASIDCGVPADTCHAGNQWRARLEELQREFTYLLIDAPGTAVNSDATIAAQMSDGAILVIEADLTRRDHAAKAKQTLEAAGVRLLGTVLHNRSFPVPKGIYEKL
jgi:hypothetical protein